MSLPTGTYPLPPGWRATSARRTRRWMLPVAIAAWILVLAATAAALGSDAIVAAGVGALVLVALTIWIAVVDERSGDERSLPELINAVTLTTAEVAPTDSWVYFFRQKAWSVWSGLWLLAGGITALGCAVVLAVRCVQLGDGRLLALVGIVPLGILAAVVALAGANTLHVRSRARWFARRPRGLALGSSGVTWYSLDAVTFDTAWSWERIVQVVPGAVGAARGGDVTPTLRLVIRSAPGKPTESVDIPVDSYEAHAWLVYSALRFWVENPSLRDELGTSQAQERMAAWMGHLTRSP